MRTSIKLLTAAAAAATLMAYGAATQAGEQPYVAFVGEDSLNCETPPVDPGCFYLSEKLQQFTHTPTDYDPEDFFVTERGERDDTPTVAPEICDEERIAGEWRGEDNYLVFAKNQGDYHWDIVLPKKPEGNLNITIQCGILKPNSERVNPPTGDPDDAVINRCAAETGERFDINCSRQGDVAGKSGIRTGVLPTISAVACEPVFDPDTQTWDCDPDYKVNLTAYRNPGRYALSLDTATGAMRNSDSMQVLDNSRRSRFALKACMTKSFFVKKPVEGQVNALGDPEFDLIAGDMIRVFVDFPRNHTSDVYCHKRSVMVGGIGVAGSCIDENGAPCD